MTGSRDSAAPEAVARQLEAENPLWMVMYGTCTRQFLCFPLFDTPRRVILAGTHPDALAARMLHIEHAADEPGPVPHPTGNPAGPPTTAGGQRGAR